MLFLLIFTSQQPMIQSSPSLLVPKNTFAPSVSRAGSLTALQVTVVWFMAPNTVTSQVSASPTAVAFTQICAVPLATAVTTPSVTVATSGLVLPHFMVLSTASAGVRVAVSDACSPTRRVSSAGSRLTSVTTTSGMEVSSRRQREMVFILLPA